MWREKQVEHVTVMNRWYVVFVALLIAGPLWIWNSRMPASAEPLVLTPGPAVGRPAPDFSLTTLDGETVSLAALRGKPVVLNFWATWCGPCQREMPVLQSAAQRFAGEVVILGVDEGEMPNVVQDFVSVYRVNFPVPLDIDQTVGDQYGVQGLPTTFFIDADGIIRHRWMGEMNAIVLAEGIAKIWP